MSLCPSCGLEWSAWLDTSPATLIPRLGFTYGSGAPYDVSAAGLRGRRASRHAGWATTVRRQQDLVVAGCRAGNHSTRRVDT